MYLRCWLQLSSKAHIPARPAWPTPQPRILGSHPRAPGLESTDTTAQAGTRSQREARRSLVPEPNSWPCRSLVGVALLAPSTGSQRLMTAAAAVVNAASPDIHIYLPASTIGCRRSMHEIRPLFEPSPPVPMSARHSSNPPWRRLRSHSPPASYTEKGTSNVDARHATHVNLAPGSCARPLVAPRPVYGVRHLAVFLPFGSPGTTPATGRFSYIKSHA